MFLTHDILQKKKTNEIKMCDNREMKIEMYTNKKNLLTHEI